MKRPEHYKTKQKEMILSYIESIEGEHVTVNHIASYFKLQNIPIGTTTIYRYLERLTKEGLVKKYVIDGMNGAQFEFMDRERETHSQYHFKCESCGELFHGECDFFEKFKEHMGESHHFELDASKTVFYGKCESCTLK